MCGGSFKMNVSFARKLNFQDEKEMRVLLLNKPLELGVEKVMFAIFFAIHSFFCLLLTISLILSSASINCFQLLVLTILQTLHHVVKFSAPLTIVALSTRWRIFTWKNVHRRKYFNVEIIF